MPTLERKANLEIKKGIFLRLIPFGIVMGIGLGGYLLRYSRKYTFLLLSLFGLIFSGLSVVNNIYVLFVSRALYGAICGLILNLIPKMIQETVPRDKFLSGYGALPNLAIVTYQTLDMLINNSILKYEKETNTTFHEAFKLHYLIAIPFILIAFILFIVFARFDTISYYVQHA